MSVRVSACMIVKDEEANLDRCLGSLAGRVDEVVVVDTGSTDASIEIAQRHGAKVVSFPWIDDFAAARNASLQQASGDWLLWIDADEELVEETAGALKLLAQRAESLDGYLLECRNLTNNQGDVGTAIKQWRLFPNGQGLGFVGRIHEHLQHADGRSAARLARADQAWIRHWGYIPDDERSEHKRARNRRLVEVALRESPENPLFHYYLGKERSRDRDFEAALESLEQALQLWQGQGSPEQVYVANMFALALNAAVETHHWQRALDLETLVPSSIMSADILFQAGLACWRLGQLDQAVKRFERACGDPAVATTIEGERASSTWRPLAALAQLHLERGDAGKAYEFARQAHTHGPSLPNLLYALAVISGKVERHEESLAWIRQILELPEHQHYHKLARRLMLEMGQEDGDQALVADALSGETDGLDEAERVLLRARALADLGQTQAQYDLLEAGCRDYPESSSLRLAVAQLLDAQGFTAEAINVLGAGLDQPQPPAELYQRLAMLLAKAGRYADAANALGVLEQLTAAAK